MRRKLHGNGAGGTRARIGPFPLARPAERGSRHGCRLFLLICRNRNYPDKRWAGTDAAGVQDASSPIRAEAAEPHHRIAAQPTGFVPGLDLPCGPCFAKAVRALMPWAGYGRRNTDGTEIYIAGGVAMAAAKLPGASAARLRQYPARPAA